MTKFIKSYKSFVADLDHAFKMDGGIGYVFLSAYVVLITGMLTYSVGLEMGWIVM